MWEETLSFTLHMPEIALVRFLVWDHDPIGRDFVGQRTVAFTSLMPGKRRVAITSVITPTCHSTGVCGDGRWIKREV